MSRERMMFTLRSAQVPASVSIFSFLQLDLLLLPAGPAHLALSLPLCPEHFDREKQFQLSVFYVKLKTFWDFWIDRKTFTADGVEGNKETVQVDFDLERYSLKCSFVSIISIIIFTL